MRFSRSFAFALALAALASLARPAAAQVVVGTPDWSTENRGNRATDVINRQDCLADATIDFDTTISGTTGNFELWAGAGCEDDMERGPNGSCIRVGTGSTTDRKVTVRVQDLVRPLNAADDGTEATCDTGAGEGLQERSLFFLVINTGDNEVVAQGTPWAFEYDILPPAPPTMVTAASGEASLNVELEAPGDADLDNYRFYCAVADSDCSAAALAPEEYPDETTFCGTLDAQGSASGATDSDLANGTLYAVGVASQDTSGNIGKLSGLACGTPLEVTGFFEAYRAAGGQAGGGFCGFAVARGNQSALAGALLLGALALWRRRR
jgi:hypothetical protein